MDIVFWIILIVVIAVIIWWLLNRNKSANRAGGPPSGARADGALEGGSAAASAQAAGTTGIPTAAGFGKPAEPAAPATAEEPADSSAASSHGTSGSNTSDSSTEAGLRQRHDQTQNQAQDQAADQAEWETQWSEAGSGAGSSVVGSAGTPADQAERTGASGETPSGPASPPDARPVHHDEYTAPHAPTLPGAETAAVESTDDGGMAPAGQSGGHASEHLAGTSEAEHRREPAAPAAAGGGIQGAAAAETLDRAQSSALVENGADHHQPSVQGQDVAAAGQAQGMPAAEPAGHLAADEPYGAGSAAPGPDGSGPADYTVKGDAAAMVYYEEGHPDYEQTRAEVWFESAAHAEAAGFRAPRRKRF